MLTFQVRSQQSRVGHNAGPISVELFLAVTISEFVAAATTPFTSTERLSARRAPCSFSASVQNSSTSDVEGSTAPADDPKIRRRGPLLPIDSGVRALNDRTNDMTGPASGAVPDPEDGRVCCVALSEPAGAEDAFGREASVAPEVPAC